MKSVFKNQFGELRWGWQIVLFIFMLAAVTAAIVMPLVSLGITNNFAISGASLAGALIATYLATKFINRKPVTAVGLSLNKHAMRELGIGCLLGWLMMTGIFGIEYLQGNVKVVEAELTLADGFQIFFLAIAFFGVAAMFEEVVFRGYLFQTLVRGIGFVPSVIITGAFFSLAHINNPNASAFGLVNTVLVSVVFCLAYWRTRSLWLPFGIHFAWNFAQTTVYGYPTSGVHFTRFELTSLTQFGPEWITGGAYGPEGGALATAMIILCGVFIYYTDTLRPFEGIITLEREGEKQGLDIFRKRAA